MLISHSQVHSLEKLLYRDHSAQNAPYSLWTPHIHGVKDSRGVGGGTAGVYPDAHQVSDAFSADWTLLWKLNYTDYVRNIVTIQLGLSHLDLGNNSLHSSLTYLLVLGAFSSITWSLEAEKVCSVVNFNPKLNFKHLQIHDDWVNVTWRGRRGTNESSITTVVR